MRFISKFLLSFFVFAAFSIGSQAQQIRGDYLESRSADVYVAQCFANSEVGLTGDQALLAWHVRDGSWDGQNSTDLR